MEVNIAVIGGGYWGKNLIRNFQQLGHLHTICDASIEALNEFHNTYPEVHTCTDYQDVLDNNEINAVVIAAPAVLHFNLARRALEANKDVFVEKPLALNAQDGETLVRLAKERDRILMVGHLLHYHPAVNELKHLVSSGELGKIQYVYSNRLNFGKIRREENILWSFAPHDISVILGLLDEQPTKISATGSRHLSQYIEDTTVSHLSFPGGVKAHIFVSWLHPFKEQKLVVVGEKRMAVFDDTLPWKGKLKLYSHKVSWKNEVPVAEKAEATVVSLPDSEPLKIECQHFINSVENHSQPLTDGEEGVRVLKVLNSLQESLDQERKIKIGIFGYNFPHKKTEDFMMHMELNGMKPCCVLAADKVKLTIPSSSIKTSISKKPNFHPKELANKIGCDYFVVNHKDEKSIEEIVKQQGLTMAIVSGARILPKKVINLFKHGVVNFHPGLIPEARGLDSMLWSIYKGLPLGVTAHVINEKVDMGRILLKEKIEIKTNDTIYDLSEKIYQMQLDLLIPAIKKAAAHEYMNINIPDVPSEGKMPRDKEKSVLKKLKSYIDEASLEEIIR